MMSGTLTKKFDFDGIQGSYPHYTKLIEVPDTLVKVSEFSAKCMSINIYPNPATVNTTIETSDLRGTINDLRDTQCRW